MIRSDKLHRRDENQAIFMSQETGAFRKYTGTDPGSAEGRLTLAMHFINQSAPDISRKFKKHRSGPQTSCQP